MFNTEPEEAAERIRTVSKVCETFKQTYTDFKAKMASTPKPWNFESKLIFGRFNVFLKRVSQIMSLFDTIIEFNRLEKVEMGGTKGKILGSQIIQIFNEFITAFQGFKQIKYDILDLSLPNFDTDMSAFRIKIDDLDRRISTILCQAFDDCSGLQTCFRLVDSFAGLLSRPIIQHDFEKKYSVLLEMYSADLDDVRGIFMKFKDAPPIHQNMAPVTGTLTWTHELKDRMTKNMEKVKAVSYYYYFLLLIL